MAQVWWLQQCQDCICSCWAGLALLHTVSTLHELGWKNGINAVDSCIDPNILNRKKGCKEFLQCASSQAKAFQQILHVDMYSMTFVTSMLWAMASPAFLAVRPNVCKSVMRRSIAALGPLEIERLQHYQEVIAS